MHVQNFMENGGEGRFIHHVMCLASAHKSPKADWSLVLLCSMMRCERNPKRQRRTTREKTLEAIKIIERPATTAASRLSFLGVRWLSTACQGPPPFFSFIVGLVVNRRIVHLAGQSGDIVSRLSKFANIPESESETRKSKVIVQQRVDTGVNRRNFSLFFTFSLSPGLTSLVKRTETR